MLSTRLLRRLAPPLSLRSLSTKKPPPAEVSLGSGRMADQSGLGPTRFYDTVGVKELPDGHFAVTIDSKPVRTPLRGTLAAPTRALATALAAEWDAQTGRLRPSSMPLTTLVATARDLVPVERERVVGGVTKYLETDSVCIRPGHPKELVEAQDKVLGGVVESMRELGCELNIVRGGLFAPQSEQVERILKEIIEGLDDYSLAGMEVAVGCAKSVVIGVGLLKGGIGVEEAVKAAICEEEWQSGVYGRVEGGHDLAEADVGVRIRAADLVFRMVEAEPAAFGR